MAMAIPDSGLQLYRTSYGTIGYHSNSYASYLFYRTMQVARRDQMIGGVYRYLSGVRNGVVFPVGGNDNRRDTPAY